MKIGKIGERALINEIAALVAKTADKQSLGIGDDAALTKVSTDCWLVTSKDMLVQGVHFLLPEITAQDLGYKALAVNLSDLAAMGAKPRHAYVALALPPETETEFVLSFYRGMLELAVPFSVSISGGDLVVLPGAGNCQRVIRAGRGASSRLFYAAVLLPEILFAPRDLWVLQRQACSY